MDRPWPEMIVGVDFGTTATAVAYSKPTESKVHCITKWPGESNIERQKVLSMVALNGDDTEAWGFGVKDVEIESISNPGSYKLFKALLNRSDHSDAPEAARSTLAFLKALYKHLEAELKPLLEDQTWHQSKVKFVFSQPSTWKPDMQIRFSDLINKAGFLATDSNPTMISLDEAQASMVHFFSNRSQESMPKPGEHILLADIGGATSDVSIFQLLDLEGRKPRLLLKTATSLLIGSNQVDEQFKAKLRPRLMESFRTSLQARTTIPQLDDDILEAYVNEAILHIDQNQQYTSQKVTFKYKKNLYKGKTQKPDFYLSFCDPGNPGMQGGNAIKKSIRITIHSEAFFEEAFCEQSVQIWNQCKSQMESLLDEKTVTHVVLAGGFGSSPYVVAKLTEDFKRHSRSKDANVIKMNEPPFAVCKGLVLNELYNIQGSDGWVYEAKAWYGIQKGGNKDHISWFLKRGDKLSVPHDIPIDCRADIGHDGKAMAPNFKIVSTRTPPPKSHSISGKEKAAFHNSISEIMDISHWVENTLPTDLRSKRKFSISKTADFTIQALMSRDAITLTLWHNKFEPNSPLRVFESWHDQPKFNPRTDNAPRFGWSNLSRSEKHAVIGTGIAVGGFAVAAGGLAVAGAALANDIDGNKKSGSKSGN